MSYDHLFLCFDLFLLSSSLITKMLSILFCNRGLGKGGGHIAPRERLDLIFLGGEKGEAFCFVMFLKLYSKHKQCFYVSCDRQRLRLLILIGGPTLFGGKEK